MCLGHWSYHRQTSGVRGRPSQGPLSLLEASRMLRPPIGRWAQPAPPSGTPNTHTGQLRAAHALFYFAFQSEATIMGV